MNFSPSAVLEDFNVKRRSEYHIYPATGPGRKLQISADGDFLTGISWCDDRPSERTPHNNALRQACRQLDDYFAGQLRHFDLQLKLPDGITLFQLKILWAAKDIPFGQSRSYLQLAQAAGSPRASRAVGQVMHHNPFSIVVPCHRVLGSGAELTGYAGGLEVKRWLLGHEDIAWRD